MKARTSERKATEQAQAGTHKARLVAITDMGHQPKYKGYPSSYKLEFTYELANHDMKDGRPFWVSEQLNNNDFEDLKTGKASTLSLRARALSPAHCREYLGEMSKLLAMPCMVTVTHNEKGYAQIKGPSAVAGVPMDMELPPLRNEPYIFSWSDENDEPDIEIWDKFPEFKQTRIQEALNFKGSKLDALLSAEDQY